MDTLSDHSLNHENDEYAGTDDDIPAEPQELPPLNVDFTTTSQNPAEEGDIGAILDAHAATTGAKSTQVRAKRVIRNPQPKLDTARLSGDRGIPTLLRHFEKVKFKGKGHETEDLNLLMHRMEHWAHRLCPRMTFDEVIARIEKLGSKKPVQVCVKKIRLDIPILDDDEVPQNVENADDDAPARTTTAVENDDWDFDDLFADRPTNKTTVTPVEPAQDEFDDLFADKPKTKAPSTPVGPPQTPSTPQSTNNTLTAEQLKRIEEKKNIAARRKAARMAEERAEKNQQSQETNGNYKESQVNSENKETQQRSQQQEDNEMIDITEEESEKPKLTSENNLNKDVFIVESGNDANLTDNANEVINID